MQWEEVELKPDEILKKIGWMSLLETLWSGRKKPRYYTQDLALLAVKI